MKNSTVLITGGGGGIGYELAKCFAADGYSLVLISRNENNLKEAQVKLQEKYQVSVDIIVSDLTNLETLPSIFQKFKAQGIKIDVLVNNSGFGLLGAFTELDISQQLNMIDLNIKALTYLTRLFLDQASPKAKILNVASMAAFLPGPLMNVYYATKAYVLSFSEALAEELQDKGISVTALCPGPVATNFWQVSVPERTEAPKINQQTELSAEFVARAGYQGMLKGQRIIIPGILNRILIFSNKFLARRVVTKIVKKLNQKF